MSYKLFIWHRHAQCTRPRGRPASRLLVRWLPALILGGLWLLLLSGAPAGAAASEGLEGAGPMMPAADIC